MLNNIKSITKSSIVYGFGNVSIKLIGLVLIPIYTNAKYFDLEDFGTIALMDVLIQLMTSVIGLSIYTGFIRWYFDEKYKDKQKSMFFSILVFNLFSILVFLIPVLLIPEKISLILIGKAQYAKVIQLVYFSAATQIFTQTIFALLKLNSKSALYSISNIVKLLFTLAFTLLFILKFKWGIEGIYLAQIIGFIPFIAILFRYVLQNIKFSIEYTILKQLIIFSLPLMLGSISGTILTIFDRYGLKIYSSLEDVAIYTLGYRIANSLKIVIVASIQLAITPLIYQKMNDPDNKRFYSKIMTYQAFVVVFLALCLSVFSYELMSIFVNDSSVSSYMASIYVIPVISISIVFGIVKDMAATGLHIQKKTKILGTLLLFITILNVVLNIILIPIIDVHGASLSTLVSSLIFYVLVQKYAQKQFFIPYENRKIFIQISLAILLISLSFFTNWMNLYFRIPIKISLVGSYLIILYLLNFFEEREIQAIRGFLNKWLKIDIKFKKTIKRF